MLHEQECWLQDEILIGGYILIGDYFCQDHSRTVIAANLFAIAPTAGGLPAKYSHHPPVRPAELLPPYKDHQYFRLMCVLLYNFYLISYSFIAPFFVWSLIS